MYELNVKNELNTTFDPTSSTRDSLMICLSLLHLVVLLPRIHICQLRGRDNFSQDSCFSRGKRRATLGGIQTHDTRLVLYQLRYQGNSTGSYLQHNTTQSQFNRLFIPKSIAQPWHYSLQHFTLACYYLLFSKHDDASDSNGLERV